jgi:hypothetical protein
MGYNQRCRWTVWDACKLPAVEVYRPRKWSIWIEAVVDHLFDEAGRLFGAHLLALSAVHPPRQGEVAKCVKAVGLS